MPRWEFEAKLVRPEGVGTWTMAPIPVDLAKETGIRARLRVRGTIDGVQFKGTLLPFRSGRHFVVVRKELREIIGKDEGDVVRIAMDMDASTVKVEIPVELAKALSRNAKAKSAFGMIAPSHQKAYAQWIEGAKRPETRAKMASKAVEMISRGKRV